jgi:Undecaprenyl-phosphate glucose phosphotransferase
VVSLIASARPPQWHGAPVFGASWFVGTPVRWLGLAVFAIELQGVVGISIAAGLIYHKIFLGQSGDIEAFLGIGAAAFIYYAIAFAYRGNYSIVNLCSGWRQVREVTAIWALVCLFLLGIAFLLKIGPIFSRGATTSFFLLGWAFLVTWRWCLAKYLATAISKGIFAEQKALVLGDPQLLGASTYFEDLRRCGYGVVKFLPITSACSAGAVKEAVETVREDSDISSLFLIMNWQDVAKIDEIVRSLSIIPLPIRLLPDTMTARYFDKLVVQVGALWAAELHRGPLTLPERCVKRIFDVAFAAVALLVLSPLLVLVGLLIKLDSRGPVLFRQMRAGFNNRPFQILKFRTLSTLEDGPVIRQVCRNDRRLTRVGRLLRRTSIDELPQLINVLRGEMSLIGPRPHAAAHNSEYEQLIGNYAFRNHVKPGLSGWAQVNGFRGETNVDLMERRVDLDLWYIDNWSMRLDVKIIARTISSILRHPMAY